MVGSSGPDVKLCSVKALYCARLAARFSAFSAHFSVPFLVGSAKLSECLFTAQCGLAHYELNELQDLPIKLNHTVLCRQ